ncbi:MAG: hypothetical protein DRO13_06430 [Thermoprotei archaeon]|nr:MAG: hypothetical protein DRO13_06430 [Thermoprotei archaeon]
MAFTWEPRWEKVKIESYGIVIHTCRDRITKMIACPICVNAAKTCLEQSSRTDYKPSYMFFFTPEDLIHHIRNYHAMRYLKKPLNEKL